MDRSTQMENIQSEALQLFKEKNKDYGDSFAQFGPIGVIIRMQDKINRLVNISKTNISFVESESLRDTLIDLHNYSAMAIMLLDEKNNVKEQTITVSTGEEKIPYSGSIGHELSLEDDEHSCWGQFV